MAIWRVGERSGEDVDSFISRGVSRGVGCVCPPAWRAAMPSMLRTVAYGARCPLQLAGGPIDTTRWRRRRAPRDRIYEL